MHHNNLQAHTARAREHELRQVSNRPDVFFSYELKRARRSRRRGTK